LTLGKTVRQDEGMKQSASSENSLISADELRILSEISADELRILSEISADELRILKAEENDAINNQGG